MPALGGRQAEAPPFVGLCHVQERFIHFLAVEADVDVSGIQYPAEAVTAGDFLKCVYVVAAFDPFDRLFAPPFDVGFEDLAVTVPRYLIKLFHAAL